jgi:hypothetical protein
MSFVGSAASTLIETLAMEMREGVAIEDRSHRFSTYKKCFLGTEGVQWLIDNKHANSVTEAVQIGNAMLREQIIHHVCDDHLFKNESLFYRFYQDEDVGLSSHQHHETTRKTMTQVLLRLEGCELELEKVRTDFQRDLRESEARLGEALANVSHSKELHVNIVLFIVRSWGLIVSFYTINILSEMHNGEEPANQWYSLGTSVCVMATLYWCGLDRRAVETGFAQGSTGKSTGGSAPSVYIEERTPSKKSRILRRRYTSAYLAAGGGDEDKIKAVLDILHSQATTVPYVICDAVTKGCVAANTVEPLVIDNEFFHGKLILALRNGSQTPLTRDNYFPNKQRIAANFVQGRCKKRIPFNELWTGQAFRRPFKDVPSGFLVKMLISLLNALAPNLKADVHGKRPYLLTPLISAAQTLEIKRPGDELDLSKIWSRELSDNDLEDTNLLFPDPSDSQRNMTYNQRRKYFAQAKRMEGMYMEPGLVYTFGFWQDIFDPTDYTANMPFGKYDVAKYMDGQPMLMLGKVGLGDLLESGGNPGGKDCGDLWNIEMWHREILSKELG